MGDVRTPRQSQSSNLIVKGSDSVHLPTLMDHLSLAPKVSFVRSSCSSLNNIAKLDENALLVLFTPVIAIPQTTGAEGAALKHDPVDPFEAFGRDLARYHQRIRHVPYLPSVGMTATHEAFARRAGAIIIVMWGSTTTKSGNPSSSPFVEATAPQRVFADAVRRNASPDSRSEAATPIVLFITGTSQSTLTEKDLGDIFRNYGNILHSQEYSQLSSRQVVDILFQE
ncbi:hypothetical protein EV356DRAFT_534932 [Viridothelium virens]|uniref:RRM domain-containing protein n=1 Tax=Viridothelium virens TaxID=1048519 RepID=A0A6A6H2H0_VIRVR|nr:hypothetical protein EV356DRAFT_534932 [Viridothelium virens]